MVREIATNGPVFLFLPMSNLWDHIFSSDGAKLGHHAQNLAGVLNLERMMAGSARFPTIQAYSDEIVTRNVMVADVPFLLDGMEPGSQLVGVHPTKGAVPAIEDFNLSLIRDQSGQHSFIEPDIINWVKQVGTEPPGSRFTRMGVSSLRYVPAELLDAFRFRFAVELLDEMLDTKGSAAKVKGEQEALALLGLTGVTTRVSLASRAVLEPSSFRALAGEISASLPKGAPFPFPEKVLISTVEHGGILFRREPSLVVEDASIRMVTLLNEVKVWAGRLRTLIVDDVLGQLEESATAIFYESLGGQLVSRMLAQAPSSMVVCSEMLEALGRLLQGHRTFVEEEYTSAMFPNGLGYPSLLNDAQQKVSDAQKRMVKDTASQAAYLKSCQELLELQVWEVLVTAVKGIDYDLHERGEQFLREVGSAAGGWGDVP